MKKFIPRFSDKDLIYLNPKNERERKMLVVCRSYLDEENIAAAARAGGVANPTAIKRLFGACRIMQSRKRANRAKETNILCVLIEDLVDDIPTKIQNGLINGGYKIVLDLCLSERKKMFLHKDIGKKSIVHIDKFLKRNRLSFGMQFKTKFVNKIREAAKKIY